MEFGSVLFTLSLFWISGNFFFYSGKLHQLAFSIIFLLGAIWLLYKLPMNNFSTLFKSTIFKLSFLYCALYLLSLIWSAPLPWSITIGEIKKVLYLLCFWMVMHFSVISTQRLNRLIQVTIIVALLALVIHTTFFYGFENGTLSSRLTSFGKLSNPLWFGAIYGAMAVITCGVAFHQLEKLSVSSKFGYFLVYLLFGLATLLTHSRGPIAALIIISVYLFFSSTLPLISKIKGVVFGGIISVLLYFTLMSFFKSDIERGQSYRLDLWVGFLEKAKVKLILGYGAGKDVYIDAPGQFVDGWKYFHNAYLGSLVQMGVIGLILHLALIVATLAIGWRHRSDPYVRIAMAVFSYACIINITFGQGIVTRINTQWVIFWLPLIIIASVEVKYRLHTGKQDINLALI